MQQALLRALAALVVAVAAFSPAPTACAQGASSPTARAVKLIQNRQFQDAIKVLLAAVANADDAQAAEQQLLLAECYYQMQQYERARPFLLKAVQNLPEGANRIAAEQRLATVAYRMGDYDEAERRIDAFIRSHPNERRVGKMLAYKMLLTAGKGESAQPTLEKIHEVVQKNIQKYGYTTGMEADRILCDFYRRTGQDEKARDLYVRLVHNFQKVISERRESGERIPIAFEQVHDNAALQLGVMYADTGETGEAVKWFENVRYDAGMKRQARLLLAKVSYERGDFNRVVSSLTGNGYIDSVPPGRVKSDMSLLLGLAEKARPDGNPARVEQYLRQVTVESKGYLQAQSALADIYHEKGLYEDAIQSYTRALDSQDHEAHALASLGAIHVAQAKVAADRASAEALYRKASAMFSRLYVKHPLAPEIKDTRQHVADLEAKGIDVSFALGDEEKTQLWLKKAESDAGSPQAAQALLSLIRYHVKTVTEEGTGRVVRAPDYKAAATSCQQLLDENVYRGTGFAADAWRALRAEALCRRGQCETASVSPGTPDGSSGLAPTYVPGASAEHAIDFFSQAQQLVDPKQLDLVKAIELGLLEALFKSDKQEHKELAEQRFLELEADYGTDARFQQLALGLADWYEQQGRLKDAAWQYAGVADRGKQFDEEDRLKLYFKSGMTYSKAGHAAQESPDNRTYAIYLYPEEVIEFEESVLRTFRQFEKRVEMQWPGERKQITAGEALIALSQQARIPFVWNPVTDKDSVATYLERTKVKLADGEYTVREALEEILETEKHRLVFDIGLTGGEPTFRFEAAEADDPEFVEANRVIEIYDVRRDDYRYRPLTRAYGAFQRVHDGGSRSALLYTILGRVEEVSETRVLWAEGIDKLEKQAVEFRSFPDISTNQDAPCAKVLASVLKPQGLAYRIVEHDVSTDLYDLAKQQFNKIRQIKPKSRYGEKSLFALAINFYRQGDYPKMKIVLREYLKLFDGPSHAHYHDACFWVGWVFEKERRYREACDYYARAAEERMAVYRPQQDRPAPSRKDLEREMSYDLKFALMEPISGEIKEASLANAIDFLTVNTLVDLRLDPTAESDEVTINYGPFDGVPALDVLHGILTKQGLGCRVENVRDEVALKAYFRLASVYRKDNLMQQALENCEVLLTRFPQTDRRRDVYQLMLDIYKGLKDYGKVLETLEDLKRTAGSDIERYKFDFEIARIYFDMADYERAAETFKRALADAQRPSERVTIRDGYAKSLYRSGDLEKALPQFQTLVEDETDPLRVFVAEQMVFLIKFQLEQVLEREYPDTALRYIQQYEQIGPEDRNRLTQAQFAKATWIYFVLSQMDLKKGRRTEAKQRLAAVMTSPDDYLAADAAFRLGMIHLQDREFEEAREVFEHLLFALRSAESSVRATYALGRCWQRLDRPDLAFQRFDQLVQRYPISPYVVIVKKDAEYRKWKQTKAEPAPAEESRETEE